MSNAMWGGRFTSSPDSIMEEINASIGFDQRLAAQDIAGSKAHAAMLAATGIITAEDASSIQERSRPDRGRNRGRHVHLLAGARRHSHEHRVEALDPDR